MNIVRDAIMLLYLIIVTPVLGVLCLLSALLGDKNGLIWWSISRFWAKGILFFCGVSRIKILGQERLQKSKSTIIMSNHHSHLDPPLFISLSKKIPVRFIAKSSLFYFPVFGTALWAMGHIAVNRSNKRKAYHSLKKAAQSIAKGKTVLVFPEGHRTQDDNLQAFKNGGFSLAMQAKVRILPVGIYGTQIILPPGMGFLQKTGPIVIVIGEFIPSQNCKNKEQLKSVVREKIKALKQEAKKVYETL